MANTLYPKYKERLLAAGANLMTGDVKAVLVNTTAADGAGNFYAYGAAHEFLSSIPVGARVGTPQTLANKTNTNGVFDADNITFPSVAGATSEALVIYLDTAGADTTDPLIAYIDTATGLPVTPNGGDITITWSDLPNRIFAL